MVNETITAHQGAQFLERMAAKSAELQKVLGNTSAPFLAAFDRIADRHGVKRWNETRDERDYDELIALASGLGRYDHRRGE